MTTTKPKATRTRSTQPKSTDKKDDGFISDALITKMKKHGDKNFWARIIELQIDAFNRRYGRKQ